MLDRVHADAEAGLTVPGRVSSVPAAGSAAGSASGSASVSGAVRRAAPVRPGAGSRLAVAVASSARWVSLVKKNAATRAPKTVGAAQPRLAFGRLIAAATPTAAKMARPR